MSIETTYASWKCLQLMRKYHIVKTMKVKQTLLLFASITVAVSVLCGFVGNTAFAANPGDSKKECKKIGGFYETYQGKSSCNANVDQKKCATYGGVYQIQYSGSKLACIIAKGSKPQADGKGTTCGEAGCSNLDPNAPVSSSDPTKCKASILTGLCNGQNGIWGLLLMIVQILTAGVGIVAIGGFVYAAILYTTAEGNAGQVTKAKVTIFNVVLGLVLYALMWAVLQFLIPGGVFK